MADREALFQDARKTAERIIESQSSAPPDQGSTWYSNDLLLGELAAAVIALTDAESRRRRTIDPGSFKEFRVLIALLRVRDDVREGRDLDWDRVLELLERSIGMDAIRDAFTELLDDESILLDIERRGYSGCAVPLSLDRDEFGQVSIGVFLSQIDGAQLSYVLGVARRYELEVREESRWLRLAPQLIATDEKTADEPAEARA